MNNFAASTTVPVEKTKMEIESIVKRYGATSFASGYGDGKAYILFKAKNRMVKFVVGLPEFGDEMFDRPRGARGLWGEGRRREAAAQEERRRWRCLLLVIKGRLEAVETGVETFEEAFLSHIILPNGETAGQWMAPQIEEAYTSGSMPKVFGLLPGKVNGDGQ